MVATDNIATAAITEIPYGLVTLVGGSVAEWLAYWTQAQQGLGLNRSCDAVG